MLFLVFLVLAGAIKLVGTLASSNLGCIFKPKEQWTADADRWHAKLTMDTDAVSFACVLGSPLALLQASNMRGARTVHAARYMIVGYAVGSAVEFLFHVNVMPILAFIVSAALFVRDLVGSSLLDILIFDSSPRQAAGRVGCEVVFGLVALFLCDHAILALYQMQPSLATLVQIPTSMGALDWGALAWKALLTYAFLLVSDALVRIGRRLGSAFGAPEFSRFVDGDTPLYVHQPEDDSRAIWTPVTNRALRTLLWPRIPFGAFMAANCPCSSIELSGMAGPSGLSRMLPPQGCRRVPLDEETCRAELAAAVERCDKVVMCLGSPISFRRIDRSMPEGWLGKTLFLVPPMPDVVMRARVHYLCHYLGYLGIDLERVDRELDGLAPGKIAGFTFEADDEDDEGAHIVWYPAPKQSWVAYALLME